MGTLFGVLWVCFAQAQEMENENQLRLEYYEGQKILFDTNLRLLSAYYDVDIAKAQLIQAKLWNNPRFVWNADMYSVVTNSYMNNTLQRLVQIEYIFSIGGKHTNNVKLQRLGVELSEMQFQNVLRGLVFEYSMTYNNLKALRDKAALFEVVLKNFETLIASFEKQFSLGLISYNDLVRLKSEKLSIGTDYAQILSEIEDEEKNMRILLNLPFDRKVFPEERELEENLTPGFNDVLASARENRPDLQYAEKNIQYQQRNYKLQISTAIPDVKFGYQPHDRGSNYQRPYAGIVLEWDVPFFNRNQGNIKQARFMIEKSKLIYALQETTVENEVNEAVNEFYIYKEIFLNFSDDLLLDIETLSGNASENFSRKTITLLQYIDYQRSFIDSKILYIDNKRDYLNAVNYLNFVSGKEIIK